MNFKDFYTQLPNVFFPSWNSVNVLFFKGKGQYFKESALDLWFLNSIASGELVKMISFYSTFHFPFSATHC